MGLQIEQDSYYYTRYLIQYNTDRSKKWSLGAEYNFGGFYNGKRNTLELSGRLAPIPQAALTVSYEYNDLKKIGTAERDLSTHLITLGSRFALNPRLQLSAFYQYNSFDEQGRWNIRASWEYQPLSFVYVVFNNTQIDNLTETFNEQQVVSKITLVKQF